MLCELPLVLKYMSKLLLLHFIAKKRRSRVLCGVAPNPHMYTMPREHVLRRNCVYELTIRSQPAYFFHSILQCSFLLPKLKIHGSMLFAWLSV